MRRPRSVDKFAIVIALLAAVIVYGCLYPFHFRRPPGDVGPLHQLVQSWAEWHGRGDFLSNILLYMPLGFFGVLSIRRSLPAWKRFLFSVLGGTVLSLSVELTQYYDAGRTTAAIDVYSNVLGTGLGAAAGCVIAATLRGPASGAISANLVPAVLLGAWLGYRFFPRLPTPPHDLLRDTAIWLTAGALLFAIAGQKRFRLVFPLLALLALVVRVPTAGTPSATDMAGAGLAFLWLLFFGGTRRSTLAAALLLAAAAILQPLAPGASRAATSDFSWMPFAAYMQGSERDVVSFLQKCVLYGGLIWLLGRGGLRLSWAAGSTAAALFLVALAQVPLLGRPADIGDPVIAVLLGAVMAALGSEHPTKPG